jgi:hypothetical protein
MNKELAQLINTRPGSSQAAIEEFYGKFKYVNASSPRGAILIDPEWREANLVSLDKDDLPEFPFDLPYGATRLICHKKVARPMVLTWQYLIEQKLHKVMQSFDGMWVARHQLWNPASPLSVHSFGAAMDSNVARFPYGTPLKKVPQKYLEFYEAWEECGWTWGGRWLPCDVMHVQWTDPVPGTPRGLTPMVGSLSTPNNRLFVNGEYLGSIKKQTQVGDKLYITTEDEK